VALVVLVVVMCRSSVAPDQQKVVAASPPAHRIQKLQVVLLLCEAVHQAPTLALLVFPRATRRRRPAAISA
jgi:hypothetical protein